MNNVATSITNSASFAIASKVKDYFQLMKFTLSFMVVFSCVVSYLLVPGIQFHFISVLELFVAGILITGASNTMNQVIERNTDSLMKRTAGRPVAAGRMQPAEAWAIAFISCIAGIVMMAVCFNVLSAILSLVSVILYAFIYTPLKKVNSIAVLVGAFPGALPCLIGWVAGANELSAGGWVLFGIQFLWQFPHFWAIAWLAYKDYERAGFKLLPGREGPTKFSALQCIIYSMLMIPVGVLPFYFHLSGIISVWILLLCNLSMVLLCVLLFIKMNADAARKVMFGSYFYLMIVFLALLFDKI